MADRCEMNLAENFTKLCETCVLLSYHEYLLCLLVLLVKGLLFCWSIHIKFTKHLTCHSSLARRLMSPPTICNGSVHYEFNLL